MSTPLRVCFFVGPSIPPAELRAACATIDAEVQVLPPIQQGDLLRLLPDLPDVIGIVDGYFQQVPAVLHKEIMVALERGARVLGAASMGALRAAELDAFGMEGIGRIYRLYRQGTIDGDDEVAVLHADQEAGYRQLGEALVNVRHNLDRARRQGIVPAPTVRAVLAHAKHLCFVERNYQTLLDPTQVAAPAVELAALHEFLRTQRVDLKRADALELVRTVAARVRGAQPWPRTVQPIVNQTRFLHEYERQYVGSTVDGCSVPDALIVAFEALLSPSFPSLFQRVRLRGLALEEAKALGLTPEASDLLVGRFTQARRLGPGPALDGWLSRRGLSRDELAVSLRERDLERQMLCRYGEHDGEGRARGAAYRRLLAEVAGRLGVEADGLSRRLLSPMGEDATLLRELKLLGRFQPALHRTVRILACHQEHCRRRPAFKSWRIPREAIEQWVAERWGVGPGEAFEEALLTRGFRRRDDFLEAARYAYLYARVGQSSEPSDVSPARGAQPSTSDAHSAA